jgi:hypothetical protein
MRKFAEVVMEQPSFRDPSSFDQSTFNCMGCMMSYMKKSSFESIPDSALQSAITNGDVKEMKMSSKRMVRGKISKPIQRRKLTIDDFYLSDTCTFFFLGKESFNQCQDSVWKTQCKCL